MIRWAGRNLENCFLLYAIFRRKQDKEHEDLEDEMTQTSSPGGGWQGRLSAFLHVHRGSRASSRKSSRASDASDLSELGGPWLNLPLLLLGGAQIPTKDENGVSKFVVDLLWSLTVRWSREMCASLWVSRRLTVQNQKSLHRVVSTLRRKCQYAAEASVSFNGAQALRSHPGCYDTAAQKNHQREGSIKPNHRYVPISRWFSKLSRCTSWGPQETRRGSLSWLETKWGVHKKPKPAKEVKIKQKRIKGDVKMTKNSEKWKENGLKKAKTDKKRLLVFEDNEESRRKN